MAATDYIAEADRLEQSRRNAADEASRTEFARREFDLLAKAAEVERDFGKLMKLRLRMAELPGVETPRRVDMMIRAGACAERVGDRDRALSVVEGALELAINHGDSRGRIDALNELGIQWRLRDNLKRSCALLREARDLAIEHDDKSLLARQCMNLSNTLRRDLKPDEAADEIHAAIRLYRNLGDLAGATRALLSVANLEAARDCHKAEREILEDALDLTELADEPLSRARALGNLGICLAHIGDFAEALARLNEATSLFTKLGLTRDAIRGMLGASGALDELGQTRSAMTLATRAEELARNHEHPAELAVALSHAGAFLFKLEGHKEAKAKATESERLLQPDEEPEARYTNAETLGRLALAENANEDALANFERCLHLAELTNAPQLQARALRLQAEALDALNDHAGAREVVLQSIELLDSTDAGGTFEYLHAVATSARIERDAGNENEARFLAEDGQNLRRALNVREPMPLELRRAFELFDELAPRGSRDADSFP